MDKNISIEWNDDLKRLDDMLRYLHIRLIKRNFWIPPIATMKRLMEDLKEKPLRWHRNKEIGRTIKIITKDSIYRLWFRIYFNVSLRTFYIETHYNQNGMDHWFADFADDYLSAYDIIKRQLTGGYENDDDKRVESGSDNGNDLR